MIGIYKITSPSNKVYIGQSINITNRWNTHRKSINNKKKTKLINSFLKYGVDNHIFEIVEICEVKDLNKKERYWQDYYNVIEEGLNLKLTQTDDKSGSLSEETKEKISKAHSTPEMKEYSSIKCKQTWEDKGYNFMKPKKSIKKEIEKERLERESDPFYLYN